MDTHAQGALNVSAACDAMHAVHASEAASRSDRANPTSPRVLIVCEHASFRFGGEASLPLHYFRVLLKRGIHVQMITHSRVREELQAHFPDHQHAITYIEDTWLHRALWRAGQRLPDRLAYLSTGFLSRVATQMQAVRLARTLVRAHGISVVHQPIPVSPREPSLLYGVGVPVVIGPMNGNMNYPDGFSQKQGRAVAHAVRMGRAAAGLITKALFRGKPRAAALIVANERTKAALPRRYAGKLYEMAENGVDFSIWRNNTKRAASSSVCRIVFVGRLIDVKAVDLLIAAFLRVPKREQLSLTIVGDGPERDTLTRQARSAGALGSSEGRPGCIYFAGWQTQSGCAEILQRSDIFAFPSLMDCGGAAVLEAMAAGLPVIASEWGGPIDYLDPGCGVLIPPVSREQFVVRFAEAMTLLSADPALRARMGERARAKTAERFDWDVKADAILSIYQQVGS